MKLRSLLPLLLCLANSGTAFALDYSANLSSIDTEEDLYDLYYDGQLDDGELEKLIALLQDPIDINSATRDELHNLPGVTWNDVNKIIERRERTPFDNPDELSTAIDPGVVDQLRSFAIAKKPFELLQKISGKAQLKVGWKPSTLDYSLSDGKYQSPNQQYDIYTGLESKEGTKLPTASLKLDFKLKGWFDAGVVLTESQSLGDLKLRKYDASEGEGDANTTGLPVFRDKDAKTIDRGQVTSRKTGYLTDGIGTHFDLAKAFIHTPTGKGQTWSAILGSYRIGFGMGTVIDNTGREFPNGWRADKRLSDSASVDGSAPNFRDDPGFFGFAASLHRLKVTQQHWLSGHIFGSIIDRDSYQRLQNKIDESDEQFVKNDGTPNKSAIKNARSLYLCEKTDGDCRYRYNPATGKVNYKPSNVTIPDAFREKTVGGNLNYHFNPFTQIGVSGYASSLDFSLIKSENGLEVTQSSPYPYQHDTFGAVGGHVFVGIDDLQVKTEYGRSFNGKDQGNALQTRAYYGYKIVDAELGFRWYDENYDNRWSSGKAASDTYQGNRTRDELGFDTRVLVKPFKGLEFQVKGDLWKLSHSQDEQITLNSQDDEDAEITDYTQQAIDENADDEASQTKKQIDYPLWKGRFELRAKYAPIKDLWFTAKTTYLDKDLSNSGRDEDYDQRGQKITAYGQINYNPFKWLKLEAAYNHVWRDDSHKGVFNAQSYNRLLDAQDSNYLYVNQIYESNYEAFDRVYETEDGKHAGKDIYANQYAQDQYWYLKATLKYELTSFSTAFKMYEEDIGFDSIGQQYWKISTKLSQSKTWNHLSASLRYDFMHYTDQRSKWYQRDQRFDGSAETQKYRSARLYSRDNHLVVGSVTVAF